MNNQTILANRYAQAFLNTVPLSLEDFKKVQQAVYFLEQHPEVFVLLKIPLLDATIKRKALEEKIIQNFGLPKSFIALLDVLVLKKRSELILEVLKSIITIYKKQNNVQLFTICSSSILDETQMDIIKKFLKTKIDATILTTFCQDTNLIAGIRMQSDELQWEYSVAKQLKQIRASLAS